MEASQHKQTHFGDPCIHCGLAHDDFAPSRVESPRDRFLSAIGNLEAIGYGEEADRALGVWRRSLADGTFDPAAIGACIAILNPLAGKDARSARGALAEMLMRGRTQ